MELFQKYKKGRKKVKDTGYINEFEYLETIVMQFIVSMIPNRIRAVVFKNLLHKKYR